MSLFGRISPKAMSKEDLSKMILSAFGGGQTATGISVSSDSAMRAMAVHSCVRIKANSMAQLPCHLMRQTGRNKEKATDHRYYELLHDQPNAWMTAPEFWAMVSACLDLRGNFYALKTGLPGRQVRELIPLSIGAVEEVIQTPSYGLFYKVRRPDSDNNGQPGIGQTNAGTTVDVIPGNRIMHIRELTLNGFTGLNPIAYARESIGLALATEKHGAKLFANGTNLNGIITKTGAFKTDAEARNFLDRFNEAFSSVENSWKTAMLEHDMKYERIGMTSEDSQFMEARDFQDWQIARLFFQSPLMMMSGRDKTATFASAEQFGLQYVTYALVPRVVNVEKAIRRDLLNDTEKQTLYAKFSVEGLLRSDIKTFAEANGMLIDKEVLNPNEVRDLLDRNPYDGGDTYRTRTSTTKQPDQQPAKGEAA